MSVSHQIPRLRQRPASLFSILLWIVALIFVSHASPIAANSQCWIGQIRLLQGSANGIYPLGPYPDRDAILAGAKSKLDELLLGQPYNDSCYPINQQLPIISTSMTCDWIGCDVESCNSRTGVCIPWISDRHIGASNGVASCSLGDLHTYNDKLNANPSPACAGSYTVRLSPSNNAPESSTILVTVEPDKLTESLVAKVYDQNGQLVPNAKVKLVVDVTENSGGHQHDEGRHSNSLNENRVGKLSPYLGTTATVSENGKVLEGNTKQDGLRFSFKAPAPAGDHKITASCTDSKNCKQEGPDTVWVGHKGLQPVGDNAIYRLIPNAAKDPGHPDNHYLTLTAASRLGVLATLYHAKYPNLAVLHLNDASLERGGIFDLNHNWRSPHWEHCLGAVIDIRANGAEGALDITDPTDPMIKKFKALAAVAGADAAWEVPKKKDLSTSKLVDQWETRHFHTKLTGQEGLQCP